LNLHSYVILPLPSPGPLERHVAIAEATILALMEDRRSLKVDIRML
jgi:hypothetical protein